MEQQTHEQGRQRAPWIEALIFLSAPGISVRLPESERMRICEREPRDKRAGILPALLQRDFYGNLRIPGQGYGTSAVWRTVAL
jgi:hypothetical protein